MLRVHHLKTFYMHVFPLQHIYHSLGKQRNGLRSNVSVRHVNDVNTPTCLKGRMWLRNSVVSDPEQDQSADHSLFAAIKCDIK